MVPLSRKPSQSQVGALTGKRLMSFATSGNLLIGSDASDQRQNTQQLPILPETRRMNMNDVLIWQKFTRRLKQRVEDRRNERRTFCWLDRPLTRDMRRNGLPNIKMEPTYRMQPDEKPDMQKCKELMEEYLENALKNVSYGDVKDINQLSRYRMALRARSKGQSVENPLQMRRLCDFGSETRPISRCIKSLRLGSYKRFLRFLLLPERHTVLHSHYFRCVFGVDLFKIRDVLIFIA
uniref:Uncharacterized protein n=1 Tax=Ciona savignyi TaxID=51511 RepID=H2YAD8_CIOSA